MLSKYLLTVIHPKTRARGDPTLGLCFRGPCSGPPISVLLPMGGEKCAHKELSTPNLRSWNSFPYCPQLSSVWPVWVSSLGPSPQGQTGLLMCVTLGLKGGQVDWRLVWWNLGVLIEVSTIVCEVEVWDLKRDQPSLHLQILGRQSEESKQEF